MTNNSREFLLESMNGKSCTWGWGAITAFSRSRLNNLIEQQFIEGYSEGRYFPVFSTEFSLNFVYRDIKIEKIILGKPLISFESASLDLSKVTVTMNLVGGNYSEVKRGPGVPALLNSWVKIKETHGFNVKFELDLSVTRGDIDSIGKVTMDISRATNFSTNIGDLNEINDEFTQRLKVYFDGLPAHKKIFNLGVLNLTGYNPLTPVSFHIRTQRAPGAELRGAVNADDGAVLVFIDLAGSTPGNTWPGEGSDFQYFIPDDKVGDKEQYSAALVIHHSLVSVANEDNINLLTTLLFPGQNNFEVVSEHTPHDRVVFGNLAMSATSFSVEPTFSTIRAGSEQAFSFKNSAGIAVEASWDVRSLNSAGTLGAGTIDKDGLYTAGTRGTVGQETLRVVVTGRYSDEGREYKASALLLVDYEDVSIAPRISERQVGFSAAEFLSGVHKASGPAQWANSQPIELTATASAGDKVTWTLLDTNYGTILGEGHTVSYIPPNPDVVIGLGLVEQRVQAYNETTGKVMYTSVLLSFLQDLDISPCFKDNVVPLQKVQLKCLYHGVREPKWSLVSGNGSVDEGGVFIASDSEEPHVNVVHCIVDLGDGEFKSGYSVIESTGFKAPPMWTDLTMTVEVVDGKALGDDVNEGTAYANGFQQIHLVVTLQTTGGELTPEEKDSLSVVMDGSNHTLLCMDSNDNFGIPFSQKDVDWAYATRRNIFRFMGDKPPVKHSTKSAAPLASETAHLYIVSRPKNIETTTFYFHLTDRNNFGHDSKLESDPDIGKVHLSLISIPTFTTASYPTTLSRVWTEDGGNADSNGEYPYDFNYVTIDYLRFNYPPAPFLLEEMVPGEGSLTLANVSLSTLQFESDVLEETMASFTGQAVYLVDQAEPKFLKFDSRLLALRPKLIDMPIVSGYKPSPGEVIISMHRVDDFAYLTKDQSDRQDLYRALNFNLTDVDGNFHGITISFEDPSNVDSRNTLLLTTFLKDPITGEVVKS